MKNSYGKVLVVALAMSFALCLSGCATTGQTDAVYSGNGVDGFLGILGVLGFGTVETAAEVYMNQQAYEYQKELHQQTLDAMLKAHRR